MLTAEGGAGTCTSKDSRTGGVARACNDPASNRASIAFDTLIPAIVQNALLVVPPSTRSAAPVVAEASGLDR